MSLPQSGPEKGQNRYVHFRYVSTPNGSRWHAYSAGKAHWYTCHTNGKSKPCLEVMTSGAVHCARCGETGPLEDIGYKPLYREVDGCPVMVILHDEQRERDDAVSLHQRVLIGREDNPADGVWISPALSAKPLFSTTLDVRRREADLTETLLRLWQLPALVDWYRAQPVASNSVQSAKMPAREQPAGDQSRVDRVNREFAKACIEARERGNPPLEDPATIGMVLPAVPIPNGRHKKG